MFVFSENLVCFVSLKHPFWDLPFRLITNELEKDLLRLVFCFAFLAVKIDRVHVHLSWYKIKNQMKKLPKKYNFGKKLALTHFHKVDLVTRLEIP